MSLHSELMRQVGAPTLIGVMVDFSDTPTVVYHPPGNGEPVELSGVIVGSLKVTDEVDIDEGTHERDEQMQEVILTIQQPFTAHLNGTFDIVKYGEPAFSVREIESVSDSLVTIRAERNLIQRLQQRGQG